MDGPISSVRLFTLSAEKEITCTFCNNPAGKTYESNLVKSEFIFITYSVNFGNFRKLNA